MKERETKYTYSVPASIQLLFNNQKLDIMKVLCLMNALSTQNKKQRKVEEILFYYSLVNFDLAYIFNGVKDDNREFAPSINQYFRFQTKINEILLIMSHLQFIEVKGKPYNKLDELKVKLLSSGEIFYQDNKSEYLNSLFDKYVDMYKNISYSAENVKKIKEGQY
ncbi:MAG: hypothetical protein E6778_17765 [Niallia nealsonii]|nr:hypothetical protein [Niallia nealsonii]